MFGGAFLHAVVACCLASVVDGRPNKGLSNDICPIPHDWQGRPQSILDELNLPPTYPLIRRDSKKSTLSLKYKHDFATADAGARVVASSPGLKGVKAIQRPSRETYMMSECSANTWVVIALPERVSVEYVGFESAESFSSYYRKVAIMGAAEYPTESWRLLAIVELDPQKVRNFFNLKDVCSRFESGACWMSHIKFQVLSYYPGGASDVCTLSRFQVYGSTLMQGLETKMKTKLRDDQAKSDKLALDSLTAGEQECKLAPAVPSMVTIPYHYPSDLLNLRSLMAADRCLSPLVLGQERELLVDQFRNPLPWTRGTVAWNRMRGSANSRTGDLDRAFTGETKPGDPRLATLNGSPVEKSFSSLFDNLFDDMFGTLRGGAMTDASGSNASGASVALSPTTMQKTPLGEAINKLLAQVLADSHVLNEESRSRQQLDGGSEVPPILALVDRLNDLQKALGTYVDKTLGLTVILKDVVDVVQTTRQETGALYREIKDVLWPEIAELSHGFELFRTAMGDILRSSCTSAFRSYALIEPQSVRDQRRTICVLSEILTSEFEPPMDEDRRAGEDRVLQLLETTDYGAKISEWNLGVALNLYIDNLRQTLSSRSEEKAAGIEGGNQRSSTQSGRLADEGIYRAALLYLDAIGALHWPQTFLHLVRLPRWNSARLVLGHPLLLYISIIVLELYNVFGQLLLSILASAIYLFVVVNAYLQFESTTEPFKERYHQFIETFRRRERLTRNNSDGQIRNWSSGVMDDDKPDSRSGTE